jgi:hypothetical protein
LIHAEPDFRQGGHTLPWRQAASALLQTSQEQESSLLATTLADLFATEQVSGA